MKDRITAWLGRDVDVMENITDTMHVHDSTRQERKQAIREAEEEYEHRPDVLEAIAKERDRFRRLYLIVAVLSCIALTAVLLYTVGLMPRYGVENPRTLEVVERYVQEGTRETGAINVISGMILDYRAFDTLGESHVLFTALICVMILLRIDSKNQRKGYEDYYTVLTDSYFDLSGDMILRMVGAVVIPCLMVYGIYILLNGQNSPGGGFSGGAVMGAALILFSAAYGFDTVDRYMTPRVIRVITVVSLAFYSFAKGYVFFMGANGLESHIPKGTPGAIFSGGLILPLDIAVGCVVGCTMFGLYSLFRRGSIGGSI